MIKGMGIFGHALLPDLNLPMIATRDVGDYAAQRLLDLDFSGKQTRELLGERNLSMAEATAINAALLCRISGERCDSVFHAQNFCKAACQNRDLTHDSERIAYDFIDLRVSARAQPP